MDSSKQIEDDSNFVNILSNFQYLMILALVEVGLEIVDSLFAYVDCKCYKGCCEDEGMDINKDFEHWVVAPNYFNLFHKA